MQQTKIIRRMGTIIQLTINHANPEPLLEEADQRLKIYEERFSANSMASELTFVNQCAGIEPVKVHPQLYELIKVGTHHSCASSSRLNIAIGPLVQSWRIGFDDAHIPTTNDIQALLRKTNPHHIQLDEEHQTVYLTEKGMAIDLGALAKGYFADLLVQYFKEQGAQSGIINLGGNLVVFGSCPTRRAGYFKIGVQNPFAARNQYALTLKVKDCSIVTSGIYERQLEQDGKTYHHILDPQTGYPAETDVVSLTIVSKISLDGEIWTTRLFGKTAADILSELNQLPAIDGIIITKNQHILYSNGIEKYL